MILNFFHWLASFFDSTAPTSSRRLQAYVILSVLAFGNVHFYLQCGNWLYHIYIIVIDMVFILLMYGLVTFQQLAELRTGMKVTQTQQQTATGTTAIVEKEVTGVQEKPAP